MRKFFLTISMGLLTTGAALADDPYSCLALSATAPPDFRTTELKI